MFERNDSPLTKKPHADDFETTRLLHYVILRFRQLLRSMGVSMTESLVKGARFTQGTSHPEVEVGQWYWHTDTDDNSTNLCCVVYVGSNYVKVEGVGGWSSRIHFDVFLERCKLAEGYEDHIKTQVTLHEHRAAVLMDKIKQLSASLGIVRGSLTDGAETHTTALAVAHGTADVQAHKAALIKAQKETLPQLFAEIRSEHENMAKWMKAPLIPMHAQTDQMQKATEGIEDRIFTVELYAGLTESVEKIRDGEPAPNDTKVSLMQRRHYMDEECLVDYKAGGMEFKDIGAFESWLLKTKERRNRIFPFPRCVVVFQVRRHSKERQAAVNFGDLIRLGQLKDADKATFVYIRNGEQCFRIQTAIDFGEELFPDRQHSVTLGDGGTEPLYAGVSFNRVSEVITESEYLARAAANKEAERKFAAEKVAWQQQTEEERKGRQEPWCCHYPFNSYDRFERCTPESVYYDDIMRYIAKQAVQHNRIAVVLQGLLDRSPVFHPHPPWQLWTAEGFVLGLDLIYDSSRAITSGAQPDFEAFRQRLNALLKVGDTTIGQQAVWGRNEADKKYAQDCENWRVKHPSHFGTYEPYGNPGPGFYAQPTKVTRTGKVTYEWQRERMSQHAWKDSEIKTSFTCVRDDILNVSAYQPGDYKQFYNDPRTRADYLQWAPMLLAAEDFVHGKVE